MLLSEDLALGVQELFPQFGVLFAVPEDLLGGGSHTAGLALVAVDEARGFEPVGSAYASRDHRLGCRRVFDVIVVDVQRLALFDTVIQVSSRGTDVDEGVRAQHILAESLPLGRGRALL